MAGFVHIFSPWFAFFPLNEKLARTNFIDTIIDILVGPLYHLDTFSHFYKSLGERLRSWQNFLLTSLLIFV